MGKPASSRRGYLVGRQKKSRRFTFRTSERDGCEIDALVRALGTDLNGFVCDSVARNYERLTGATLGQAMRLPAPATSVSKVDEAV